MNSDIVDASDLLTILVRKLNHLRTQLNNDDWIQLCEYMEISRTYLRDPATVDESALMEASRQIVVAFKNIQALRGLYVEALNRRLPVKPKLATLTQETITRLANKMLKAADLVQRETVHSSLKKNQDTQQ